jgi:hypothetical protein
MLGLLDFDVNNLDYNTLSFDITYGLVKKCGNIFTNV